MTPLMFYLRSKLYSKKKPTLYIYIYLFISHKTARVVQLLLLYDIIHLGAIPSNQIQNHCLITCVSFSVSPYGLICVYTYLIELIHRVTARQIKHTNKQTDIQRYRKNRHM